MTSPRLNSWEAARKVLPSGQSTQPLSSSTALSVGRGAGKVQVDGVQFGNAQLGAFERVRVCLVAGKDARPHVVSSVVAGTHGIDAVFYAEEAGLADRVDS